MIMKIPGSLNLKVCTVTTTNWPIKFRPTSEFTFGIFETKHLYFFRQNKHIRK